MRNGASGGRWNLNSGSVDPPPAIALLVTLVADCRRTGHRPSRAAVLPVCSVDGG
jgi:hypothetical protein